MTMGIPGGSSSDSPASVGVLRRLRSPMEREGTCQGDGNGDGRRKGIHSLGRWKGPFWGQSKDLHSPSHNRAFKVANVRPWMFDQECRISLPLNLLPSLDYDSPDNPLIPPTCHGASPSDTLTGYPQAASCPPRASVLCERAAKRSARGAARIPPLINLKACMRIPPQILFFWLVRVCVSP